MKGPDLSLGFDGYTGAAIGVLVLVVSALASGHAVLTKREERAAIGWVGVIWLAPLVGASLYLLFGINRIQRRASRLRDAAQRLPRDLVSLGDGSTLDERPGLTRHMDTLTSFPLCTGHAVEILEDGDAAFPAMLQAIERAQTSIALSSYIFDRDRVGLRFAEALGVAHRRGCQVRVLVDDAGLRYSFPSIMGVLRARSVKAARFMPAGLRTIPYINLRTHRKILVVDGMLAFTGGINIREGHELALKARYPVRDLHFSVRGPVVEHLMHVFADDWMYTTGERLEGSDWFSGNPDEGSARARVIPDGPDEDFDKLRWAFLGGIAAARRRLIVVTPYFLPDETLMTALIGASYRGVEVDVLVPERVNLPYVQWAMWGQFLPVVEACRVHLSPPPFDHTKLMLVDDDWALVGSGNWDPRSFRLNFELQLELQGAPIVAELHALAERRLRAAKRVWPEDVTGRPLWRRLRDGTARLASPYL